MAFGQLQFTPGKCWNSIIGTDYYVIIEKQDDEHAFAAVYANDGTSLGTEFSTLASAVDSCQQHYDTL